MGFLRNLFNLVKSAVVIPILFVSSLFISTNATMIERNDKISGVYEGKKYNLNYETIGFSNEHFIDMSKIRGVTDITCDIDDTRLLIVFGSTSDLTKVVSMLSAPPPLFLILNDVCSGSMIRRVLGNTISNLKMEIETTPARYDEIFNNATIRYEMNDIPICLGFNTKDCKTSYEQIPIYHNSYVDVQCSDCFVGLNTNVFFNVNIKWFKLESISGGFKKSTINGDLVLDTQSQYHWSLNIDKTYSIVKPTTIITFYIGVIPIRIWFEIPIQEILDLSFDMNGKVKFGGIMNLYLGDDYLSWDTKNKWSIHKDEPVMKWNTILELDETMNVDMIEQLNPTFILHVNDIYTFWLYVKPKLIGNIKETIKDKEVCEKLDYIFDVDIASELGINIPWTHIGIDKKYDEKNIIHKQGTISSKCFSF